MNKCLERVNDRHFWNPGVVSYAMIPAKMSPQLKSFFFFHRHIYSLWLLPLENPLFNPYFVVVIRHVHTFEDRVILHVYSAQTKL
jgi:hypothetical protein